MTYIQFDVQRQAWKARSPDPTICEQMSCVINQPLPSLFLPLEASVGNERRGTRICCSHRITAKFVSYFLALFCVWLRVLAATTAFLSSTVKLVTTRMCHSFAHSLLPTHLEIPAKKWGDTEIAERGRSVLVMRARYRSARLTPHQRGWTDAG